MDTMMKKKVPITMAQTPAAARLWNLLLPFYLYLNFN